MTFESIFRTIHGYDPFPWQSEAARLMMEGESFSAVNVPTASGKTAMIDAAIYAAAHGGPRRVAFIIDRRVVVDEAYARAKRIADALSESLLPDFSSRLGPIQVVRLRGGVYGDDDWILYPEKVTVIVSTVDQVGSRLLHRGYGVSSRKAPMHAGFVGNDALYIIDEAHLSTPFIETVEAARSYGAKVRLIAMTATPVAGDSTVIGLSEADRSHPVLKERLRASKIARLVDVSGGESDFIKHAVTEAEGLSESNRVIGLIVNRVATARKIQQALIKRKRRAELLTGRIRSYDRDRLMDHLLPEIRAGRIREEGEAIFIVATQTVEVGADIDFDAMITEAAPLDVLRQRFGRLDRLGKLGNVRAAILNREPKLDKKKIPMPDPIYGMAIHNTWGWLKTVAKNDSVDFGVTAMEETLKNKGKPLSLEPKHAPTLLPAHIDLLSQTGPEAPVIDISAWLHGAGNSSADVSIVWRGDLPLGDSEKWPDIVRLRPPLNREALEIPVYAARTWLEGRKPQDVSDLEGVGFVEAEGRASNIPALRWRGSDDVVVVNPQGLRPGDTIIVPAQYGGCDNYGWIPGSKTDVEDIADVCSLERGKDHIVRLVPELTGWLGNIEARMHEALAEVVAAETDIIPEVGVDQGRVQTAHSELRILLGEVDHPLVNAFSGKFEIELHPLGLMLRGHVLDEVDATFFGGVAVELDRHLDGVAQMTDMVAQHHPDREQMVAAARLHDLGKKEYRFQTMLHGNLIAAAAGPPLAKSGMRKRSEMIAAYYESGLPKGYRHELGSLGFSSELSSLIRHLIATHHGYGRPWFPLCADPNAPGTTLIGLGSGWVQDYTLLSNQLGPWALAEMELLLRAADVRQSIAEQDEHNERA